MPFKFSIIGLLALVAIASAGDALVRSITITTASISGSTISNPAPKATTRSTFGISKLTTTIPNGRPAGKKLNRLSFTFADPTVPNGVDVAICEMTWPAKGGKYDYFVPDYTRCNIPFFGFRIANKTYKNPSTFKLDLQHKYQVRPTDAEWTTFFASLSVNSSMMPCFKIATATVCKQKKNKLVAKITASKRPI
ncbi:Hypothetical protein D9617_1g079980 [Elsinoe fawcettii]|nr:Hypothetical protein D9617_1g079980 [Elsinoe fawcettii]